MRVRKRNELQMLQQLQTGRRGRLLARRGWRLLLFFPMSVRADVDDLRSADGGRRLL